MTYTLHTINSTAVTKLMTGTLHFSPNPRWSCWSIFFLLGSVQKHFRQKVEAELKYIYAKLQIFLALSRHDIIISWVFSRKYLLDPIVWPVIDFTRRNTSIWNSHKIEQNHGSVFPRHWPFVRGIHRSPMDFPLQRPVTRSFDIFFDLRLNKRLCKQSGRRCFETQSWSLWRHRNGNISLPS